MIQLLAKISARERVMLAALVLVGSLIWLSSLLRNWETVATRHRKIKLELNRQAVWLADADRFERELEETLARLDQNKTYNDAELITLIDSLAREHKVSHDLGVPVTVEEEVFLRHTLKVGIKNAPLKRLIAFERDLTSNHPYASIEDFTITANKADPRLLSARLTVTAYQLASEADDMDYWYD